MSATVWRLLLDRIEAQFTLGLCLESLRSWTQVCMGTLLPFHICMLLILVSGSHVWISPSIVVHMLPCWLCQVDVLLLQLLASNAVGSYRLRKDPGRLWVHVYCLLSCTDKFFITATYAKTNLGDEVECSVEISYAYTESESGCLTCFNCGVVSWLQTSWRDFGYEKFTLGD